MDEATTNGDSRLDELRRLNAILNVHIGLLLVSLAGSVATFFLLNGWMLLVGWLTCFTLYVGTLAANRRLQPRLRAVGIGRKEP